MTQLTDNIYAVPVPEDANGFDIYNSKNSFDVLTFYEGQPSFQSIRTVDLPPGNWQYVCCWKGCTEEQAVVIVGDPSYDNGGTKDENGIDKLYEPWIETDWPYDTALESLASLLRSKGLNVDENYAFLKLNQ